MQAQIPEAPASALRLVGELLEAQMIDAHEGFRPIADYGLLADCNSAALVDRDGSIGWLCQPRYDSPAVFTQILDPEGGHWQIKPTGAYRSERCYLPGTVVIETTFATEFGTVKLTDAMAFAEGQRHHGDRGEPRAPAQQPDCILDVLQRTGHRTPFETVVRDPAPHGRDQPGGGYSERSAVVGSIRVARRAGR